MPASSFSFFLQTDLRYGAGISLKIPEYLKELNASRIGIIYDAAIASTTPWSALVDALKANVEIAAMHANTAYEPDYDYLDRCRAEFMNKDIQCVIGVGGGSTLDMAKAVSVLITNPGPAIEYRGFNLIKNPGPPVIAVPTTAGTASEVTPYAVFIDKQEQKKLGINTSMYVPRYAVLDPTLTVSCPFSVTVGSGMDAIVHAVESYVAKGATPLSRMFAKEACSLLLNALPAVVKEPDNLDLRGRMLLGALYAGASLMNAGAGPAAALSYPLGVRFKVPHGMAGAVFLPVVVQHNVDKGFAGYAGLYSTFEGADAGLSDLDASRAFAERLRAMTDALQVPRVLNGFGVERSSIPLLAEETAKMTGQLNMNPFTFAIEEITATLEAMVK